MNKTTISARFAALCLSVLSGLSFAAGPVTISGAVPDEATKAAILNKVKQLYGPEQQIIDQVKVGGVVAPPEWSNTVQQLITPNLKSVTGGQLNVNGSTITIRGNVGSEEARQSVPADASKGLSPVYTLKSDLRVVASEQNILDKALANRIIEFESGRSTLTPSGQVILDEMSSALKSIGKRTVEIIGHTDGSGNRNSNIALSKARAEAVKAYLVGKGIDSTTLLTEGLGPDHPVAPNTTEDGRRRNRRIEFRITE